MVGKRLFFIVSLLVFPSLAQADFTADQYPEALAKEGTEGERAAVSADMFTLSGYAESGKKFTSEDYEEENLDGGYHYRNYHISYGQKVSDRLSYYIGSFIYDKDYDTKDSLDNTSRIFKTNWSYYLRKLKEESLALTMRLNYKEKRYDSMPASEYDQIRLAPTLTFRKKNLYAIDVTAGVDNYDYLAQGVKEQRTIFGKIGADRYFLDKKLMLISSYKLEQQERKVIDRKRTRQEVLAGLDYVFAQIWVYKITSRAEWGQRDSKEEEERDEDYDYKYWRYYTKTEHRITPKVKTNLKYQYCKKDYVSADLDHRGFYIQDSWDYEIVNNEKQRVWLDMGIEHKDVEYSLKPDSKYEKETAEFKASYQRKQCLSDDKAGWKVSAALGGNAYDFNDAGRYLGQAGDDQKRCYAKLSGEKLFLKEDLVLLIDLKYTYTDYEQKNSEEQKAGRASFEYRF